MNFIEYRDKFEIDIVLKGLQLGVFSGKKQVPVSRSRMAYTSFAKKLGLFVVSSSIFAIDYYGYLKKSSGFIDAFCNQKILRGKQLKSAYVDVVHFASIKMEDISYLDSNMLKDFPEFKKVILTARGFNKNNNCTTGECVWRS